MKSPVIIQLLRVGAVVMAVSLTAGYICYSAGPRKNTQGQENAAPSRTPELRQHIMLSSKSRLLTTGGTDIFATGNQIQSFQLELPAQPPLGVNPYSLFPRPVSRPSRDFFMMSSKFGSSLASTDFASDLVGKLIPAPSPQKSNP